MRFLQDLDIVVQFVLTLSLSILCPCLLNTRAAQRLLQSFAAAFRSSPSPAFPLFLTLVVVWSELHFQAGNSNYHAVAAGAAYLYSPPSASKAAAKRAMIVSANRAFIFSPGGLCGDGDSWAWSYFPGRRNKAGQIRESQAEEAQRPRVSCPSKHEWPLALPRGHRWPVGFALGFLANLWEGFLQTQMLAVANHWPPAVESGTSLSPPFTRVSDVCASGGLLEACWFEFYYHGYALVSLNLTHFLIFWMFLLLALLFILGSVCSVFNSNKSRCFSVLITRIRVAQHEQTCILAKTYSPHSNNPPPVFQSQTLFVSVPTIVLPNQDLWFQRRDAP